MNVLIVLAKAPRGDFAKRRLSAEGLARAEVAALADAFLRDTLVHARDAAPDALILHFTPASEIEYFRALDPAARCVPQPETAFGERLKHAFRAAFEAGATHAVIVGADTPHLAARRIRDAFAALSTNDAVLGPATDGGYYLLGLKKPCDSLFDGIEWSTEGVLAATLARAAAAGLATHRLDETFDVDRPGDLEKLRRLIERGEASCPFTERVLSRIAFEP